MDYRGGAGNCKLGHFQAPWIPFFHHYTSLAPQSSLHADEKKIVSLPLQFPNIKAGGMVVWGPLFYFSLSPKTIFIA